MNPADHTLAECSAGGALTLAWATNADVGPLLTLFERAFGYAMPRQQWEWKYAGLDTIGSMALRDAVPVAFYGGIPREIAYFGERRTAVQISDVMVLPAERGILTRRGAFFRTATAYAERFVGAHKAYSLAFGFPSARHTRLGNRLGLYAPMDRILEATWTPLAGRASLRHKARLLHPHELGIVDELWARMSASLKDVCVAVRDCGHIERRFLTHPVVRYLPFLVTRRLSGRAVGLVVLRDQRDAGVELIDAVAEPASIGMLVRVARRVAARLGRHRVYAWLTPSAAQWFGDPAIAPVDIPVPTITWGCSPDLAALRGRWWLTGGDTDFR